MRDHRKLIVVKRAPGAARTTFRGGEGRDRRQGEGGGEGREGEEEWGAGMGACRRGREKCARV